MHTPESSPSSQPAIASRLSSSGVAVCGVGLVFGLAAVFAIVQGAWGIGLLTAALAYGVARVGLELRSEERFFRYRSSHVSSFWTPAGLASLFAVALVVEACLAIWGYNHR